MSARSFLCAAALVLSGPGASAQKLPVYESTGTVVFAIDGKRSTYHTTANTVPNQPGRMIHTAGWKIFAPMMLGGVDLAPPGIFVSLSARPTVEPSVDSPDLKITFSLDKDKYTLLESAPLEVVYIVKEGPLAGEYQYAAGSLRVESATRLGPDVLEIVGRVDGTLTPRKGGKNKSGSSRIMNYEATFSVQATGLASR